MILRMLGLLKGLSGYHYRTIVLTMILPVVAPPVIAIYGPDHCVLRIILYVVAFLVWSVLAVLAVAAMLERDRSEAERHVGQKLDELAGHISELREDHEHEKADIRHEVDNLESVVRTTFEQLGVDLPPRPMSLRGRAVAGTPRVSAAGLTIRGGSRMTRIRRWLLRTSRQIWEVVYGKPEES